MTPRRLLVMQLARLGDLVQTWPLLAQLRRLWPQARLHLLCEAGLTDLVSWGPPVQETFGLDLGRLAGLARENPVRAWRTAGAEVAALRRAGYDLVFNLNFSRLPLLLAHLMGAPVRGYLPVRGGREFGRDPWLAYIFALAHARRLNRVHLSDVFRHLAPPAGPEMPAAEPGRAGEEPLVVLQLGTRHPKRTWPRTAFAELARLLAHRQGARFLLLGTRAERPEGDWLVRALPVPLRERVENLMGRTTLPELAQQVRRADLVISGDTGTLHLAAGLGVRTLGLFFGPAQCHETGPYGVGHAVLQAEPPCHPCREAEPCPEPFCDRMIPPETAARTAAGLLRGEPAAVGLLPAGVRLYESGRDWLGVTYLLRQGPAFGLIDLAGAAYRRAAARVLGLNQPAGDPPEMQPGLKVLLAELAAKIRRNGGSLVPGEDEVLVPLLAFRQEVRRQAAWQGGARWQELWQTVHQDFLRQVEEWAA